MASPVSLLPDPANGGEMGRSSDVLIGLNAGTSAIRAAAFDLTGHELGIAALSNRWVAVDEVGAEQDPAEIWQLAARAIRVLGEKVPDLARRTLGLAITGQPDGTWLIDEDGDPVAPALLWLDRRAAPLVDSWRGAGVARAAARITGSPLCPALQSAQLAWLLRHRREAVEQAAHVLHCKDWLYRCCTGECATDHAQAVRAYGDLRTGMVEPRVLELLDIEEAIRLLPEPVDGSRCYHALTAPASAATRLWEGTPVVLGPPEPLAAALGAGILASDRDVACTLFGTADVHARARPSVDAVESLQERGVATMPLPGRGTCARIMTGMGTATATGWLLDLAEELIADAGLIGLSRADLSALLDRKAVQATPGRTLFHASPAAGGVYVGFGTEGARGGLPGMGPGSGPGDLVRAIYEGMAFEARACHAVLGGLPDELRIAGRGCAGATFRRILAAVMGRPVHALQHTDPATAGAALVAMVALGHHARVSDGLGTWVERWLSVPELVDEELQARYAQLFESYTATRAPWAGSGHDRGDPN